MNGLRRCRGLYWPLRVSVYNYQEHWDEKWTGKVYVDPFPWYWRPFQWVDRSSWWCMLYLLSPGTSLWHQLCVMVNPWPPSTTSCYHFHFHNQCYHDVVRPERGLALMAELQLGLLSSKFAAACKVALHYLKFWIYTPTMGDIVINLTTKGNSVWFPAELLQIWQISVRADQYVTCDKLSAFFLLLGAFVHKVVIVSSLEKGLPLPPSCYCVCDPLLWTTNRDKSLMICDKTKLFFINSCVESF